MNSKESNAHPATTSTAEDASPERNLKKLNGWGYQDTKFKLDPDGNISLTGSRYALSGSTLPLLRKWMEEACGLVIDHFSPAQASIFSGLPAPKFEAAFICELGKIIKTISVEGQDRVAHSHGQSCYDIYRLRYGNFDRVPDVVVWPTDERECEALVKLAQNYQVCLIPFGGGTNVSGALDCPQGENRCIVSVDTTKMKEILWIDEVNMTARVQAGIVGQDLEKQLAQRGFCTGHEPDSVEFSTLGGWIATRASGMKRSLYGNIEDIVVSIQVVTPKGILEKSVQVPRVSMGPDIHHFFLGSEGTLGLISAATVRLRLLPEYRAYDSLLFPSFQQGVSCLRELAKLRLNPTSIRLVDNEQFRFGMALKPSSSSWLQSFVDGLKRAYITRFKGYDPGELCVATMMYEGSEEEIRHLQRKVYQVAERFQGIPSGQENGRRGYFLTFLIAYLRDIGFDYYFVAESFETCVPWAKVLSLCRNVKDRIHRCCDEFHIPKRLVSCRVTQSYDTGACVYFYFGFCYYGLENPMEKYHEIEELAREEVLANGGSLSHHHGIGKLRKKWLPASIGKEGIQMLQSVKTHLDPDNIFGSGNLL